MKVYSVEEQRKHLKEWAAALRSGEYEQCMDDFKNGKGQHCAVGVGIEVSTDFIMPEITVGYDFDHISHIDNTNNTHKLRHSAFCNYYGLTKAVYEEITDDNDDGVTFEALADYLEEISEEKRYR